MSQLSTGMNAEEIWHIIALSYVETRIINRTCIYRVKGFTSQCIVISSGVTS